jgi:hypothetical protein
MLHANQFLLCGDEDGTIQSKPPLLNGSIHDGFPLSVILKFTYVHNGFVHNGSRYLNREDLTMSLQPFNLGYE